MNIDAAPIQSVASAVSGTDNPISLVDWISSFIQTLEKFNVGNKIATVSITLCPACPPRMLIQSLESSLRARSVDCPLFCSQGLTVALHWSPNLIYGLQTIIEQAHLDVSVCDTRDHGATSSGSVDVHEVPSPSQGPRGNRHSDDRSTYGCFAQWDLYRSLCPYPSPSCLLCGFSDRS